MSEMDDALRAVVEARAATQTAVGILDQRRDQREAREALTVVLGELAVLIRGWESERDRWR